MSVSLYRNLFFLTLITVSSSIAGCASLKPYEKEFLLGPLMDDRGVASLGSPFAEASYGKFERLASGAPSASGSTSCPTCGG